MPITCLISAFMLGVNMESSRSPERIRSAWREKGEATDRSREEHRRDAAAGGGRTCCCTAILYRFRSASAATRRSASMSPPVPWKYSRSTESSRQATLTTALRTDREYHSGRPSRSDNSPTESPFWKVVRWMHEGGGTHSMSVRCNHYRVNATRPLISLAGL